MNNLSNTFKNVDMARPNKAYDDTAPVRLSQSRMEFLRENYPTLANDVRFIETAKELRRQYVWANDDAPWTPPNNPNASAAYYVTETDIHNAAKVFLSIPYEVEDWKAQSTDDREVTRMPYAGGFEGGFESDAPESLDIERTDKRFFSK